MTGLASITTMALVGIEGRCVEVETHIGSGLVGISMVGLPGPVVREAKERVRAALQSCGMPLPQRRVTINLNPADIPKTGAGLDLAIALSVLAAGGAVWARRFAGILVFAELGLDGTLHSVPGLLPALLAAREAGIRRVIVAAEGEREANLVPGIETLAFEHLADVVVWGGGHAPPARPILGNGAIARRPQTGTGDHAPDLCEIRGQGMARWALKVAAVGRHHISLRGDPGAGKTMLATRLPSILPDLSAREAVEVTSLHSVAGTLDPDGGLIRRPPLQAPHHTASAVSLIGGGATRLVPGSISLAHHGVLFLDEAPEFPARVLDALRQPMEQGRIAVHRAVGQTAFPASFQLIMASNPCPCGARETVDTTCGCTPVAKRRYAARLSGPLMDRVDISVHMGVPTRADLAADSPEDSASALAAVRRARLRSQERLRGTPWHCNAELPGRYLREGGMFTRAHLRSVDRRIERGALTMRGADRILRLSLSIADLGAAGAVRSDDIELAFGLRNGDFHV